MIIGFRKIKVITGELGPCCDRTLTLLKRKTDHSKVKKFCHDLITCWLADYVPTYVLGIRNEQLFIYVVLLVLGFPQRPMLKYIHNLDGKCRTRSLTLLIWTESFEILYISWIWLEIGSCLVLKARGIWIQRNKRQRVLLLGKYQLSMSFFQTLS